MSVDSCLAIPGNKYYLKLYPHVADAFGGDICCAGILSIIDTFTLYRLRQMEAVGEKEGLLWVRMNLNSLCADLCGMYSARRVQDRLNFLIVNGFLVSPQGQSVRCKDTGKPMSFLLNRERVTEFLKSGMILEYREVSGEDARESQVDICPPEKVRPGCGGGAAEVDAVSTFGGVLNLKVVEELEEELEELHPPTSSHPRLDNYTPCDEDGEPEEKPVQRKKWPSRKKQERPKGLGAQIRDLVGPQDGSGPLDRPATTTSDPAASPVASQAPQRVDYAARWNELVPERKTSAKSAASYRPRFESEFDSICAKVSAIAKSKPDSGWMTFNWLFKSNSGTGQFNWERLLDGEYDWMAKSQPSGVRRGGADPEWVKQQLAEIKARQQKREQEKQRREKELQPDNQRRAD